MKRLFNFVFPTLWLVVCFTGIVNAYANKESKLQQKNSKKPSHLMIKKEVKKKPSSARKTDSLADQTTTETDSSEIKTLSSETGALSPDVLRLALLAYKHAEREGLDKKEILTIINYDMPSTAKRLWVINLKDDKVLYNTWVAHGQRSGDDYARYFSNDPKSLSSSLGVFVTGQTYYGHDGYSLRLRGLENGFNSNAYARDIVMHGAWYVSPEFIRETGRLGRSWGCPAVSKSIEPQIVNQIKDGTVIFAYYPERKWLQSSKYLQPMA